MPRNVSMQFGRSGGATQNIPGLKLVQSAEVLDSSTVTLEFEPATIYLLFLKSWTASTMAYYSHHIMVIATPEEDVFGTVAVARGNAYASTNNGVTVTNVNDSTVTLKQNGTARNFRYALYRVGE